MNIDKDKLIELAKEAAADFIDAGERIDQLYEGERTLYAHYLFSENELSKFADLVSAHAIASMQTEQEPYAWVYESPDKTWQTITSDPKELKEHIEVGCTLIRELYTHPAPVTSMQESISEKCTSEPFGVVTSLSVEPTSGTSCQYIHRVLVSGKLPVGTELFTHAELKSKG